MTSSRVKKEYFNWMYHLVCDTNSDMPSYRQLLHFLHETDFTYILPMDSNRADDGEYLRYRFACEADYDHPIIFYLDDRPCSVLEMMVALALRCEEDIMGDPDVGNRTGQWFWNMIVNLRLDSMDDENFDEEYVDYILEKFLNREYEQNGEGGLFTVNNKRQDLRLVEIWSQMCWYLDEVM